MKLRVIVLFLWSMNVFSSGAPVFDVANWFQNAKMIVNQASDLRYQIDQYKNQVAQYQTMLQNSKSLTSYQWDNADSIINNLLETTNTIDYYKQEAGSMQGYLDKFQSAEYYQKLPCFNGSGKCSPAERKKIIQNKMSASVAQKRANDAMLKGIDKQQQNLKKDSEKLKKLQTQAQSAEGQKQALQAASQLASHQTNQLLQIRSLMVAQQNAQAVRDASNTNKEAIVEAGDERFRAGTYHKSSGKKW
ncbi:P-type conjugative transfer protein TrbJ [Legionella sp. W05-934-2]|uniref:P-type conjugative transfer protein TrbJ n=1 Tax=Legionella sp. W05-934-2 TaxID=1198649 RepID=UPI0034625CD0